MSGGIPNSHDDWDDEEEETWPIGMVPRIPNMHRPGVTLDLPGDYLGIGALDLFKPQFNKPGLNDERIRYPRTETFKPSIYPGVGISSGPGGDFLIPPEVVPSLSSDSGGDDGVDESNKLPTLVMSGGDYTYLGNAGSSHRDDNTFSFPDDQGTSYYWDQPVGDLGYFNTPEGVVHAYVTGEPGNYEVHTEAAARFFDAGEAKSNDELIDIIYQYAEANDGYPYLDNDDNGIPDHWAENDPDFGESADYDYDDTSDIDLDDMSLYSGGDDYDDSDTGFDDIAADFGFDEDTGEFGDW